jgi:predicted nucleotidyltransferase
MGASAAGRFLLRLPTDLHQRLRREALRRGVSLNGLCVSLLDRATQLTPAAGDWAPWVETATSLFGADLVGVVLFGSVARGEQREGSDVDLLVVLGRAIAITRSLYRRWDEARPGDERVNPHFVHLPPPGAAPSSLWIEVALDGLVLHDPRGDLAPCLSALRRALALGVVRPGMAHGQRYWVHGAEGVHHA